MTKLHGKQVVTTPVDGEVPVFEADGTMASGSAGGAAVAGANKQVQFNDGGAMGAEAGFEYDTGTNELTVNTITTASACNADTSMSAGTSMAAGTTMDAGTDIRSIAGHVRAATDFRLTSPTANTGGGLVKKMAEAVSGALSGAGGTITLNIPEGAILIAVQLRVNTLVEISGGITWNAAYSGGSTQAIVVAAALAKNTKVNKGYSANADEAETSGVTNITITPTTGLFDAGDILAVATYYDFITLDNQP